MVRSRLRNLSVAFALLTVQLSCGDGSTVDPTGGKATLAISVNLSGTMVAMVVADVTAPDIPTMLVFNIPIVNGTATGTITIPAGSNRTITLRAFDAGGVETHNGSVTIAIQAGTSPAIPILLTPLTGNVPITATLGSYIVQVTQITQPPLDLAHLAVGDSPRLAATIRDTQGNTTTGVVTWATHNPGVATVDDAGRVTCTGAGTTSISAVFQGVTGTATITVIP
jgi:Big-like domain-containing protein